jgi:hypothetical protein
MDWSWKDYWSPSEKFVVFVEPNIGGQFYCVNVSDGTTRPFGRTNAYSVGVAWATNSSRVFCVSRIVGLTDVCEATLLDPATGKMIDCTVAFRRIFQGYAPDLDPVWTTDNKYVLVNSLDNGAHLIHPDPWTAIPLGRILAGKFNGDKNSRIRPRLFRVPIAGWVGVLLTGNWGDCPVKHVADYSGNRIVALPEVQNSLNISPDGTMAVSASSDKSLAIHNLGKWWITSATGANESSSQSDPCIQSKQRSHKPLTDGQEQNLSN